MMNEKPSRATEKKWLKTITDYGCAITGSCQIQRHHCVGREWKSNKYHIGRWFVLPLHYDLHDPNSNNPLNVTHHRKAFVRVYGRECDIFKLMCSRMEDQGIEIPFCGDVMDAIMRTGR